MNKMIALPIAAAIPAVVPELTCSTPSQAAVTAHPDADLLDLAREYERLLAIETPLSNEKSRLWNLSVEELRWQILGVDPKDKEAQRAIVNERYDEFLQAGAAADEECGYNKAWRKFQRSARNTARVGRKILKLKPRTIDGLLVRARVIETHDEILRGEPVDSLLAEIRDFAARTSPSIVPAAASSPSDQAADPIFAAIEAHQKAAKHHSKCLRHQCHLEKILPLEKCKPATLVGDEMVEANDPRFTEAASAIDDACDEMFKLARALLSTDPTTIAGTAALLKHASIAAADDDWKFPEYVDEDDDDGERFSVALMRHASGVLMSLSGAKQA